MILQGEPFFLKNRPMPEIVPPVPVPAMIASICPPSVWSQISCPVSFSCASMFHCEWY